MKNVTIHKAKEWSVRYHNNRSLMMRRLFKSNIFGAIIMAPFFISMFFMEHFWFWLTFSFYILLFGILLIILGFVSRMQKIESSIKRLLTRIVVTITGIGLVIFFTLVFSSGFLDIPAYLSKDYKVIRGKPDYISSIHSKSVFQTIEINNISLKSVYIIPEDNSFIEYKAYYLPNSKYVIKLFEIN
ncbi:hypothetical protein [Paenibacillus wynnii]|uniref:hypothetical protein n=1 Tax=Paenibacillus wynnii TaxID=268407 RepID=UPI00279191B6|nr:hypothetical protein [Paenibacillus wynnii]MDQ0194613.1 hypothetical protein [Paenibacillus wynnii]